MVAIDMLKNVKDCNGPSQCLARLKKRERLI
jgi:hypothetical protein